MMPERYAPEVTFPAYAFVPGRHPHPVTDPKGHSFGHTAGPSPALNIHNPQSSAAYLHAIDLFNAGFYWEAHEEWEGLWVAAGRTGIVADFLKGLIKLAAAGVKAREGQIVGVQRHAKRAGELFRNVRSHQPEGQPVFSGLDLDDLIRFASQVESHPRVDESFSVSGHPVLAYHLTLVDFTV